MNVLKRYAVIAVAFIVLAMNVSCEGKGGKTVLEPSLQKDILRVQLYDQPVPDNYKMIDWRDRALKFDKLAFDKNASGVFLPLIWEDYGFDTFGMAAYVGDPRMGQDGAQEAVTTMAAVLSGTLMGLDKSKETDYVEQLNAFFSDDERIILNNPSGSSATTSMWYLLYPSLLFAQVSDLYDDQAELRTNLLTTIESWYTAYEIMYNNGQPDFDYTGFNFKTMEPYRNGIWSEPDSAAGIGLLMYYGYEMTGEDKYLTASIHCMEYIEQYFGSPLYEDLMYFAPYLAAKLNALHETDFDLSAILNDTLTSTAIPRGGWGTIIGNWGEYTVNGLLGSTTDGGGYAFAMNTFAGAGAIVPMVQYDARFARDIGVWMLNLASNARYFLASETDADNQSCTYVEACQEIDDAIKEAVPYEGIRRNSQGHSPWIGGDPTVYGWAQTDFSLYSGAHMGILAALVKPTNVDRILRLDLQATQFYNQSSNPTFLLYNPYPKAKEVKVEVDSIGPVNLFDTVTNTIIASEVSESTTLEVPGNQALVVVELPTDAEIVKQGRNYYVNGEWISRGLAALHIVGPNNNEVVSGEFQLELKLMSNYDTEIDSVVVEIDGKETPFQKGQPIVLKTQDYTKGTKKVMVTVTTPDGATDKNSIRLRFE